MLRFMKLQFLGATGTVTGSKYLLEAGGQRVLVDCGLFQGFKQLRLRNWTRLPVAVKSIDAVVLTHAHIDHSGYLPLLVKNGFQGKVWCTRSTADLCAILLPDAGHLQEEEARYANRHGYSRHTPALPLFSADDAREALKRLHPVDFDHEFRIGRLVLRFQAAGHILGAASALIEADGKRILFSGDLGRPNDPLMRAPAPMPQTDFAVVESTYGDRKHPAIDPEAELEPLLARALARRGVVVIPAFAVGRAQALLLHIARLKARAAIPDVPVFLNSPMAAEATRIYQNHSSEHSIGLDDCRALGRVATVVSTPEESKALNFRGGPMIIVSASGMATGGRVLHHISSFAPDANNLILFAGYQAGGTRGAAMVAGAASVKIHGEYVPIRADVAQLLSASSHADGDELLAWMRSSPKAPKHVFITHGEPSAADALRHRVEEELGWSCEVPDYLGEFELT